jgi:hypothetical protein
MLQQLSFFILFYGDHQYLPHLPSNKGGVVSPPIAETHIQLSLLSPATLVGDGLVAVEDAFTKSFAPAAMVIVDPRWREVGLVYWGRLLVICWSISFNSLKKQYW